MKRMILFAVLTLMSGAITAGAAPYVNAAVPKLIKQDPQGYVILHGSNTTVHGTNLRYEPQTNKLTIGYWSKVEDWVSWDFEITKLGTLTMEILQGCGRGSGGSHVEFIVAPAGGTEKDEQKIAHVVHDTGHFQKFVSFDIGTVKFEKVGTYVLSVKPKTKPGAAVMDLRLVILKPTPPADPTPATEETK